MADRLKKITLNLTEADIANAMRLAELPAIRTRTQAISTSLAFTKYIVDALEKEGARLFLKSADGEFQRIVMPDLESGANVPEGKVSAAF